MKHHIFRSLVILAGVIGAALINSTAVAAAPAKPNVILFLVDDMGWMDCTPYGSQYYQTPNIERFAARSMRFTDAYACPLCSPTRCSILTGKYSARHGITSATGHQPPQPAGYNFLPDSDKPNRPIVTPESKNYMEPGEFTLAEALHDAGYRTGHFGKWHLGLSEQYWPERQGFDVALHGTPDPGPASYFSPGYYKKSQTFPDGPAGEYITDRYTSEVCQFIEANRDRPFFVNFWQHSVHGPWGFKKEYADKFLDRRDPRGQQGNALMASMLQSVDESLGRVLGTLDRLKLSDNTIVIFFSDNGGNVHSNTPDDKPKSAAKREGSELEQNWRKYAGDLPPTNNAPLRNGKGTLFEGGVRVPLMIAWPGVAQPGSTNSAVVGAIDLYPTIVDMLGLQMNPAQKVDGISITPALRLSGPLPQRAWFTYFPHGGPTKPPGVTVRAGDWKLIRWFETSSLFPDDRELYNLKDDLGETRNLASAMPEKVKELDALIETHLRDTGALLPKPNPKYQKPTTTATAGIVKTETQAGEPIFDGWRPKGATAVMHDGVLTVTGEAKAPFLGISGLKHPGPVTLRLKARATNGGPGKIQWRTTDQETFPTSGQIVEFTLAPSSAWSETTVELPITGTLMHLRVYLPAQKQPVDVDFIEAKSNTGKTQRWEFK